MEHLEGKNHKKKEAMAKNAAAHGGATAAATRSSKHLYCELCDVVCTCSDTFAAHLRGTKHNKVLVIACDLLLAAALHGVLTLAVVLL